MQDLTKLSSVDLLDLFDIKCFQSYLAHHKQEISLENMQFIDKLKNAYRTELERRLEHYERFENMMKCFQTYIITGEAIEMDGKGNCKMADEATG